MNKDKKSLKFEMPKMPKVETGALSPLTPKSARARAARPYILNSAMHHVGCMAALNPTWFRAHSFVHFPQGALKKSAMGPTS